MPIEIISAYNGDRLTELAKKEEALTDEYLSNTNHIQTEFILNQFFPDTDPATLKKLKLLNISYSLPYLIADKFSDYTGEPQTELEIEINRQVMAHSWGGYGIFNCQLVNSEFKVEYHTPAGYIRHPNGDEDLLTFYEAERDGISKRTTYYILMTRYYNSLGYLENRLYERKGATSSNTGFYGEEVGLDTLDYTRDLPPTQRTFLNRSPLVVFHNKKIKDPVYGVSDVVKVQSLVSSIEIAKVNIQDQLLKHLRAKFACPASHLPVDKNGRADIRLLEAIAMEAGDPIPQYIFNQNPLIEKAFEDIEDNLRQIGTILALPLEFFNLKDAGGVESAEAKGIRLSPFLKKIQQIRDKVTMAYDDVLDIARQWGVRVQDEEVAWDDVFPISKSEQVDELKKAKEANFISTRKSIMRYQDITAEDAEQELQEILEEKTMIEKILHPQNFIEQTNPQNPYGQSNPPNQPSKVVQANQGGASGNN